MINIESVYHSRNENQLLVKCTNPELKSAEFKVLSVSGQVIQSYQQGSMHANWSGSISLNSIESGTYILILNANNKSSYIKFVVH
jgi:hypothetical protein